MLVQVIFFKEWAQAYGGQAYTYRTALPLKRGDKVIAPTASGDSFKALVVAVDVPETAVVNLGDGLLNITEYHEGGF